MGSMIPLRLVGVPTGMLLAICLLLGLAAAAPLPGVAWSKLEIWEGSAAADVWLYAADYLDFRKYALAGLSDLGFLDHLIDHFASTLRVISGVGGKTLMTCVVVAAADRIRARKASGRGRTRTQDSDDEKADDAADVVDPHGYTLEELRTRAYDFVSRLLRDGPVTRVLSSLRDDAGGVESFNVLEFFSEMDMRFFPITEEDREAAVDACSSFVWDPGASFSVNWSDIENRVEEMTRLGVDAGRIPDRRQMYRRLKLTMLRCLPGMQSSYDHLERTGGPASGTGACSAQQNSLAQCMRLLGGIGSMPNTCSHISKAPLMMLLCTAKTRMSPVLRLLSVGMLIPILLLIMALTTRTTSLLQVGSSLLTMWLSVGVAGNKLCSQTAPVQPNSWLLPTLQSTVYGSAGCLLILAFLNMSQRKFLKTTKAAKSSLAITVAMTVASTLTSVICLFENTTSVASQNL